MGCDKLIIGTRGSRLALMQSEQVADHLRATHEGLEVELRVIQTQGDRLLDTALSRLGGKGVFTKEIEQALLAEQVDLAVHSLKDMPTTLPAGLVIGAVTQRVDAADVLVGAADASGNVLACTLATLPKGAVVMSGSLRRRAQLLHRRPDLNVVDVRGNVQTRLAKLDRSDASALLLAAAGLERLGLARRISERWEPTDFLPACGQGALAVEVREEDERVQALLAPLDDWASRLTTAAERTMLAQLGGGCQTPIGGYAQVASGRVRLVGMIADLSGVQLYKAQAEGAVESVQHVGEVVAQELLGMGGSDILDEIARMEPGAG